MRTPKTPPPFSERQVLPEILEGSFVTRAPEEAFGGIPREENKYIRENVSLAEEMANMADEYQVKAAQNHFLSLHGQFMAEALQSQGTNAIQYKPGLDKGRTTIWQKLAAESTLAYAKNNNQRRMISEWLNRELVNMNGTLERHVAQETAKAHESEPVSYTHLTLPTKWIV